MYWHKKITVILLWIIVGTISSYGATLTVVSKIVNSGIQTPNTTTDKVNGRLICANGNDNENTYPGCDMSDDVGYDANTDTYSGDLIVRTGDSFTVAAGWNISGGNDDVTITSTLPSGKGLSWSKPINGLCSTGSSISDDGLTLTCVRSGYTDNSTASYSEDTEFGIDVSESALNDTDTGNFSFTVSANGANEASDTSSAGLKITASPRWNLQLNMQSIQEYNNTGTMGYMASYVFSIEMDEVAGEDETAPAYLGSENLGMDVTIPFTADLNASDNTTLVDCLDANTNYYRYPIAYYYSDAEADRSVATLKDKLDIQCSQASAGDNISVNYGSLDLTMKHIPIKDSNDRVLPVTRKFGAVGTIRIFVPYSDINATEKKTDADGDDYYELPVTMTLNNFDPNSASGASNFGSDTESLLDNSRTDILTYYPDGKAGGEYSKLFYNATHSSRLKESVELGDGRGEVTPGADFTSVLHIQNTGTKDFNTSIICDVIDSDTYDISRYPDGSEPVEILKVHTQADTTIEYAVGYVTDTWPNPDPAADHSDDVIKECSDSSVTWYSTYDEAKAAGTVTKVRVKVDTLKYDNASTPAIYAYVHHKARGTRLSNGSYLPANTYLVNYMAGYDDVLFKNEPNNWYAKYKDLSLDPVRRYPETSDRVILVRAKARISADFDKTNVGVGDTVNVTVHSTLTSDGNTTESDDNVTIKAILSQGVTYVGGSSNLGEPTITDNGSVLVWSLGTKEVNQPITDLNYSIHIEANANKGSNNSVEHQISAPTVDPIELLHSVTTNLTVNIPVRLMITKSVLTPFVKTDTPIEFESYVRNGTSDAIDNIDIIDTLPFIGDGTDGFDITMDDNTTIHHTRTPATNYNGTLTFSSAEGKDECVNGTDWYYSNTDPRNINLSPKDDSNKLDNSGSTNWCAGDETGPGAGCGFAKADVTAVRMVKTDSVASDKVCTLKVTLDLNANKIGDIYTNTTGASADSVTLPVLSNDVYAIVPTTSIGDFVWRDDNKNGIQDDGEAGVSGIKVILYQSDGNGNYTELKNMTTDADGFYKFTELDKGDYKVGVDLTGTNYKLTDANIGDDDTKDSDVDTTSKQTDPISLPVNKSDDDQDIGLVLNSIEINGTIYDDGNGDGNVDGTAISEPDNTQLYVTLLDDAGAVVASKAVADDGTYSFDENDGVVTNKSYKVVLSTELNATVASLPENWNNADGEKSENDKTNGLDGSADGIVTVEVETTNVLNNDFGINNKPTATDKNVTSQVNPGGNTKVDIPALEVNDREDGTPTEITIKTLPTNGKLYCDGAEVTATGATCAPDKLSVDPDDGELTVSFTYTTTDKAGVESEPADVNVPFTGVSISGNVFDDGDGDANVNGTAISAPDAVQLYVTLLDNTDTPIATKAIASDGTYSFDSSDGLSANSDYTVVVSKDANATVSSLPTNWNNTGENINSAGTGKDSTIDGKIAVSLGTSNIPQIDFGINKKPTATDKNETAQVNPGGDTKVVVPTLEVSDKEDGTPTTITVKTLPTNGKLYYNDTAVSAGEVITSYDASKLTVDPDNGALTVTFTYTTTDRAGVESDEAEVNMPFTDLMINGTVYDDGNGNSNVDGIEVNKADNRQLYVTLLDGTTVVASKAIDSNGKYVFTGDDGLATNKTYKVVLSTEPNATTASLPTNWNNADGEKSENDKTNGLDGSADGIVEVAVATTNVLNNDFGINKAPTATDKNETSQFNPGGTTQVTVPTLEGSDKESTILIYKITELPTNAKLYCDGTVVTTGTTCAPDKLTVDPDNGTLTVSFKYTTTDEAGVESEPADVVMPFTGLSINGTVYDDGNGDGNVNGSAISVADNTQLYVTLLDGNTLLASKALDANGKYEFTEDDGIEPNKTFTVLLSTEANATIATLPINWNNADGEKSQNSKTNGTDGSADGKVAVVVENNNVENNDFGINKKPTATDKNVTEQLNPGSDTKVAVPTLSGDDKESGANLVYTITELPENAKLYCENTVATTGTTCAPDKLKVDPDNGDLTVTFKYTTTDQASVVSEPATVNMPFVGLNISGNVYDDGDGDANVNGTPINKAGTEQLYATLLDSTNAPIATKAVENDGTYSFDNIDGINPNSNYSVVLSKDANATSSTLPIGWNNTGENINSAGAGKDATVDGKIAVAVKTSDISKIDFGINHKPTAVDKNESAQLNPGGDIKVAVPTLSGSDDESGSNLIYTIATLPTNAKLYCDGAEATVGTTCAPDKLSVDPDNGEQIVELKYTTTDEAGVTSDTANIVMPFKDIKISGDIFDDGNNNGKVDGDPIAKPDGVQLYVALVDRNSNLVASKTVSSDGKYSFNGADGLKVSTDYSLVLSTQADSKDASLPQKWNNTGENINSLGDGDDGNSDGIIAVSTKGLSISKPELTLVDFGINKRPEAKDIILEEPIINSSDVQYHQVPTLIVSDKENGTPTTITIKTLPDVSTGVLYYDEKPVTAGQVITDYDPSKLTVDPVDGNPIVEFDYTTTDAAGIESNVAHVKLPFKGYMYVGDRVWLDANGNGLQDEGEEGVEGIVVKLYSKDGSLLNSTETNSTGEYQFEIKTPGEFYLEFDKTKTYTATNRGDNTLDSDVIAYSNKTELFTMDWGQRNMNIDAGIVSSVGNYVWYDENLNGIQDKGEPGVTEVKVTLLSKSRKPVKDVYGNIVKPTKTDKHGYYHFDSIVPNNDYIIKVDIPKSYLVTLQNRGSDELDSDANKNGEIFISNLQFNDYTLDTGIYCDCDDYKVHPGEHRELKASALNVLGLFAMIMAVFILVRREE